MTKETYLRDEAIAYLEKVEHTPEERQKVMKWVKDGNSAHENPWGIYGENGSPKDYISAQHDAEFLAEQHANGKNPYADTGSPHADTEAPAF